MTQILLKTRLVVINPGVESEEVELHFATAGGTKIFNVYETSEANDLRIVDHRVKNNRYNFPAESVTTIVFRESGIKGKKESFK